MERSKVEKCSQMVRSRGRWPDFHRCTFKGIVQRKTREGIRWYCTVHDPEKVKERDDTRYQKYDADLTETVKGKVLARYMKDTPMSTIDQRMKSDMCPCCGREKQ